MPEEDINIFEENEPGYQSTSVQGCEHMDKIHCSYTSRRAELISFLQGRHLDKMTKGFINRLSQIFQADTMITNDSWMFVPDLYDFMRRRLFRASIETTCGEFIFSICPTFYEDFWAFDDSFYALMEGIPRWWAPQAYESREKMLDNLKRWQSYSAERFEWQVDDRDVDYEPLFGSSLMRAMQRRHRALGYSDTGKAADTLGYLMV